MTIRNCTILTALGLGMIFMTSCTPDLPPQPSPQTADLPAVDHDADMYVASATVTVNINSRAVDTGIIPVATVGDCMKIGISGASLRGSRSTTSCLDDTGKVTAQFTCHWTGGNVYYNDKSKKLVQNVECIRPGTAPGKFNIDG